MIIPVFSRAVDERFLMHRLKSTSLAGVVGAITAVGLFAWHYSVDHVWSWDLFAVAAAFVGTKLAALSWYRLTD